LKKKKVLLIDGNAFCYRAFYAIRSLSTSKGQPTNAIYGFVTMLNKLIAEHKPQYLAVTFDVKGPTFRHKKFTDYKAHRKPMPDELSVQLPTIKKILQGYRIPIFEKAGFEADDIIATLAKKLAAPELEILIVTADKDILQVVNNTVKVINPHKDNLVMDQAWVKKRFGVSPEKIAEIMALAGDTSDNIPGVPGIGEATAIELIKKFGSLDEVLANLERITNKTRAERIREFAQQAQMSRELARLDCNVSPFVKENPSDLLAQLKVDEADNESLFEIFKELEFKSLMQKVAGEFRDKIEFKIISQPGEAEEYVRKILKENSVAVYLTVSQQESMLAEIGGVAFAFEKQKPLFFSLQEISLDTLKPIFDNEKIKKIGHNLKYVKVLLSNCGITLGGMF